MSSYSAIGPIRTAPRAVNRPNPWAQTTMASVPAASLPPAPLFITKPSDEVFLEDWPAYERANYSSSSFWEVLPAPFPLQSRLGRQLRLSLPSARPRLCTQWTSSLRPLSLLRSLPRCSQWRGNPFTIRRSSMPPISRPCGGKLIVRAPPSRPRSCPPPPPSPSRSPPPKTLTLCFSPRRRHQSLGRSLPG